MKNTIQGRRGAAGLRAFAAAILAALILAMPVAAATITGDDVVIRNSPEDKGQENSIGSLNTGDTVTVLESTTDASGTEWYLVQLPNKNQGYVKAQWVDNGGETVKKVDSQKAQTEETAEKEKQDTAAEDTAEQNAAEEADDAWTEEDPEMFAAQQAAESAEKTKDDSKSESGKASDSQETPNVENGDSYNPYTDPEAHYSIHFYTENDGTGEWYIYNYDTDKRVRIGDLEELSEARASAEKNASAAGVWRTVACILLILLVIVFVILYLVVKRNRPSSPRRSSSTRARRRAVVNKDDEDEDDEFSPRDDEEPDEEDSSGSSSDLEDSAQREAVSMEMMQETAVSSVSPAAIGNVVSEIGEEIRESSSHDVDEESEEEEEDDDVYPADDDDYDEDEDDEDEDDYGDEEENAEPLNNRRAPKKGGFLGFIKNIFSSDGLDEEYDDEADEEEDDSEYEDEEEDDNNEYDDEEETEEDDYVSDDYDDEEEDDDEETPVRSNRRRDSRSSRERRPRQRRTPNITFDEDLDYPEDAELISLGSGSAGQSQDSFDNAQPSEEESGDAPVQDKADLNNDNTDFYADDDDDMDYSFLSGASKRGR